MAQIFLCDPPIEKRRCIGETQQLNLRSSNAGGGKRVLLKAALIFLMTMIREVFP